MHICFKELKKFTSHGMTALSSGRM